MCTHLPEILKLHAQGKITKKGVEELMRLSAINPSAAPAGLAEENSLWKISGEELSKLVEREKGDLKRIMGAYRLRIEGAELLKEIEKYRKRK